MSSIPIVKGSRLPPASDDYGAGVSPAGKRQYNLLDKFRLPIKRAGGPLIVVTRRRQATGKIHYLYDYQYFTMFTEFSKITIYDKSELESIEDKTLKEMIKEING